jgi:hypothetical protein
MSEFDPSEPAVLHDRSRDAIETWIGDMSEDWAEHAIVLEDGAVQYRGRIFDGWGNVAGG